jgi:hypothetical protein
MDFEKLRLKDFKHTKDEYFHFYHERSNSNEGEMIYSHHYETRCKIFNVNSILKITLQNPTQSFEELLPAIKENLRWLEDQEQYILQRMATQRNADDLNKQIFNSNATLHMDDKKFMKFLVLSTVSMFNDHAMTLKFNEFDNIPGTFFAFDISADKQYQHMSVQGF